LLANVFPANEICKFGLGMHTMEGVLLHPETGQVLMNTRAGEEEIFLWLSEQEGKDELELDELQEKYSRYTQLKKIVFYVEEDPEEVDDMMGNSNSTNNALMPEGFDDSFDGENDSTNESEMIVIGTPLVAIASPEERAVIDLDAAKNEHQIEGVTSNGLEVEVLIVMEEHDVEKFWRLFYNEFVCIEVEQNYAGAPCWPVNLLRDSSILTTAGEISSKYTGQKNMDSEMLDLEMEEEGTASSTLPSKSFAPYIIGLPDGVHSISASLTNPSTGKIIPETVSGSISFIIKKLSPYEYNHHEQQWRDETDGSNYEQGDPDDEDILNRLAETVRVSSKRTTKTGEIDTVLSSLGATLENRKREQSSSATSNEDQSQSRKRLQKSKAAQSVKPLIAVNVEIEMDGIDRTLTVIQGQDSTDSVTKFCQQYYYNVDNIESDGSCEEEVSLIVHESLEKNRKEEQQKQALLNNPQLGNHPQIPARNNINGGIFAGASV